MSTNRCAACNAPLSDNGQPTCEYCGNALASGARDWVAADLIGWENWLGRRSGDQAASGAAKIPDAEERVRLVSLMAEVAKADGHVDANELKMLRWAATRWQVPWARVQAVLNDANSQPLQPIARGTAEGEALLRQLIAMAKADGRIDARERKLINVAALHLGLSQRVAELLK